MPSPAPRGALLLGALAACVATGCGGGLPVDGSDLGVDASGISVDGDGSGADAPPVDAAGEASDAAMDRSDAAPADGAADAALDLAVPDAAAPDAALDLAVPDAARPDAATDAAAAARDGGMDLASPDLWNCAGGYLGYGTGDAGNAPCPLRCGPLVQPIADEGAIHVDFCTPVVYQHNPPASGPHWPWHADWGVYAGVPQREWWVHCLEHGGVVLLYNCPPAVGDGGVPDGGLGALACPDAGGPPAPASCPNEIAALAKLYEQRPIDGLGVKRIVVAPDPRLPHRFAAVAWDWTWTSDQLDLPAIQCFIDARYGRGPEEAP